MNHQLQHMLVEERDLIPSDTGMAAERKVSNDIYVPV
jgi:hypothetical protein